MSDFKLTIIMCFCDKDFCYLENMLNQIKNKILVNHEILLLDNRENNKEQINIDKSLYTKIYSFGFNGYNFSRIKLIKYATGNYIWFIDCDDEIVETIDDSFLPEKDYDVIEFYFDDELGTFGKYFRDVNYVSVFWNKWIKKDFCENAWKGLENYKISFGDDIILIGILKENNIENSYIRKEKTIYNYRNDRSSLWNSEISIENFRNSLFGFFDGLKIIREKTTNKKIENNYYKSFLNVIYARAIKDFNNTFVDFLFEFNIPASDVYKYMCSINAKKEEILFVLKKYKSNRPDIFDLSRDINVYYAINQLTS